tara:strand:+ start:764 stop:1009 length:246 start_codon:yes stop_codon:yes gene_type:complete
MEDFYVYSKDECIFCRQIRQVFLLKGISFQEMKLDKDFDLETFKEKFKSSKSKSFPQILHGEKYVGGFIDTIKYLKEEKII